MDQPTVSVGTMFDLFSKDERWARKVVIVGACILIPFVGPFQLIGYGKRCYQHLQEGNADLPTPSLGEDIGGGFKVWLLRALNVFPAVLLLVGCAAGCAFGGAAAGTAVAAAGSGSEGGEAAGGIGALLMMVSMVGGYGMFLLGVLVLGVLSVDLTRRLYNGESFPLFAPGASLGAIRRSPGAFVMTWLGLMLAGVISSLGVILCYVGLLFTAPLGVALSARVLAQWDAVVKANLPAEEWY